MGLCKMKELVLNYIDRIMQGSFDDEFPQLVKCLLFENYLCLDEHTKKLFMNTVYQNRSKLNEETKKYFDYYVRKSGYYSHSLLKKDHFTDYLYKVNDTKLSEKQYELLEFLDSTTSEYNFISAPTSFGKTKIIFDYIVAKYERIIVIVPTKALINEYKNKIRGINSNLYVTSNPSTDFCELEKYIFVCTQERLNLSNCQSAEILIIDEAQIVENINEPRTLEMVIALRKFSVTKIFICPYVDTTSISEAYAKLLMKEFNPRHFMATESDSLVSKKNYYISTTKKNINIRYVLNNKIKSRKISIADAEIPNMNTKFYSCIKILKNENKLNSKNIFYISTKSKSLEFASVLQNISTQKKVSDITMKLIDYFREEYSSNFILVDLINNGIAIHNTYLDPFARRIIEYIYNNENELNNLIATSTIAAGVNLNCENLFYLSKRNNEKKTETNNILGRSGRFSKFNVGNNYYFPTLTHIDIIEDSSGNNKITKLDKKVYEEKPETDVYEDLKKDEYAQKIKIYKYYVSREQLNLLEESIGKLNVKDKNEIYNSPLKHENLVKVFNIYFRVIDTNYLKFTNFFAVIFQDYLSRKSYKQIIREKINRGIYYNGKTFRYSIQNLEEFHLITNENLTKEIENKLIFKLIENNNKYCEFMLKRAITLILYIIQESSENKIEKLDDLYKNFEYNVDNVYQRKIIERLSDFGIEDKYLINCILKDISLQNEIVKCRNISEIKEIVMKKFGENSYYMLSFEI